jgi:hypothetical protein
VKAAHTVELTANPQMRIVLINGECAHLVSINDGTDTRGGSSDSHQAIRRRAPWPRNCKNFIQFAEKEHKIFCRKTLFS